MSKLNAYLSLPGNGGTHMYYLSNLVKVQEQDWVVPMPVIDLGDGMGLSANAGWNKADGFAYRICMNQWTLTDFNHPVSLVILKTTEPNAARWHRLAVRYRNETRRMSQQDCVSWMREHGRADIEDAEFHAWSN